MDYILKNNDLIELDLTKQNKRFPVNESVLITRNLTGRYFLIVNTFLDVCLVTDDYYDNSLDYCFKEFLLTPSDDIGVCQQKYENSLIDLKENYSDDVTFILTITYKCNMKCSYCFQQNSKTLIRETMTLSTLSYILDVIENYIKKNPNKTIHIGLFGGEPLLRSNEQIIDIIFEFCRKHKIKISITTNGLELDYFAKKLVIYHSLIEGIGLTIDSVSTNEVTREVINKNDTRNRFKKLVEIIKILLKYNVFFSVSSNFDSGNLKEMKANYDFFKTLYNSTSKFKGVMIPLQS